jgi:hypothetical protein
MKFAYTMLFVLVTLLSVTGCSNEEPKTYESKNVVRKKITASAPEETVKNKIEKKRDITGTDISAESETGRDDTLYITSEGDNLWEISKRKGIYSNPLKWPLLYRDNAEILTSMNKSRIHDISLPKGIRLKLSDNNSPENKIEAEKHNHYVVNVVSSPYMEKLTPLVVKMMDEGYYAYLTSATIKDNEWYRLRAGFYRTRSEANSAGEKLKEILKVKDIWTAKIEKEEFLDFGGY